MLAGPTRVALGLAEGTPRHYGFELPAEGGRRVYINSLYASLNEAGAMLHAEAFDATVQEAAKAFEHNIDLFGEEPFYLDSVRGALNVCSGYALQTARGYVGGGK